MSGVIRIIALLTLISGILFQSCETIIGGSKPPDSKIDPGILFESPYWDATWHPSGKFISFNHIPLVKIEYDSINKIWKQDFNYDSLGVWIIKPDGTGMKRIFPHIINHHSWSADGEWVAFSMNYQIYKIKFTGTTFDTTQLIQLTFNGKNFWPAWSPDGEWIAYDSNVNSERGGWYIWKMRKDGSGKKQLYYRPNIGEVRAPSWSPDFKILHWRAVEGHELFMMDSSGTDSIQLTHNKMDEWQPAFSPLGDKIAFLADGIAPDGRTLLGRTLWVMGSNGENLKEIFNGKVTSISWSPDNKRIVFTLHDVHEWNYTNGTLWIIDVESGELNQLTFNGHSGQ